MFQPYQIKLDQHFDSFAHKLISEGRYASIEDVVVAGLLLLEEQELRRNNQSVELPENFSRPSLNTFADESLQSLVDMLDAEDRDKEIR